MHLPSPTSRGARTRQRLLDAAREGLAEGDGDVAIAEVAARAGVSAGAPYRHFPSKSHLVVAVVEAFFDDFEEAVYKPTFAESTSDWWEAEQVRIDGFVAFFFDHPIGRLVARGMACDAEVSQAQRRRLDKQTRGAARNVARGKELGFVASDVEPMLAGALLMGGLYQAVSVTLDEPEPDREALATVLKTFMARVLGMRDRPPS